MKKNKVISYFMCSFLLVGPLNNSISVLASEVTQLQPEYKGDEESNNPIVSQISDSYSQDSKSLGVLNQLIPNNNEAVTNIGTQLGISPTDSVTQEQLDTIKELKANASGWDGFQHLTNLTKLNLISGNGTPSKDVQFLLPLTSLTTLSYSGYSTIPNSESDSAVDMSPFGILTSINQIEFLEGISSLNGRYSYYYQNIPNPFIGIKGERVPMPETNFAPNIFEYDSAIDTFKVKVEDGQELIISAGFAYTDYGDPLTSVSEGITYKFLRVRFSPYVYGNLVITSLPEIDYDVNSNVSESQFLADINAEFSPSWAVPDVYLSSNFSEVVDLTKPGSYKVTLNTILPDTIDSRAKATPVEVTVDIKNTSIKAEDVTVRYVDEDGKAIPSVSPQTISGNVGDSYDATTESYKLEIPGYTLDESKLPANGKGTLSDKAQTVTYVYKQIKDQSTVVVHDSELTVGDTWKPEDNFDRATDYYGNALPFSDITVDGSVDTSKAGTYKVTYSRIIPSFFSAENQGEYSAVATITVKDAQPVKGGDVTARYIDTEGNKISDYVVKSGNVGDDYTTEQKAIVGYTFKEVQGNATGQFTDQAQTVTYVYTKKKISNITGTVLVKYVDTEGNKISEDIVKSGTVGEGYSTEKKDIKGYTFKEIQGNLTGQFTGRVQIVSYVYTKNKVNPVNSEPKTENKLDSKDKNNNKGKKSSTQHSLPATGEDERMTTMSIILGLILLALGAVVSIFRFKKVNKGSLSINVDKEKL
ncbi:MucBP domain-containing protein [Enterococcus faecalis]|uniref:MucBP domain-containing protein n=1 Tax=Enterococcus faecalis TaxID=1351 RepID=UPI001D166DF7|nr:MucBP domain-containing protein [Enterococcus faecalis]